MKGAQPGVSPPSVDPTSRKPDDSTGDWNHSPQSPVAQTFRKMAACLNGLPIEDCQDLTVGLLASVIVSHYRQTGMPLEMALECADAAIADVKRGIRTNWSRE